MTSSELNRDLAKRFTMAGERGIFISSRPTNMTLVASACLIPGRRNEAPVGVTVFCTELGATIWSIRGKPRKPKKHAKETKI
jgi:hypothetical protein